MQDPKFRSISGFPLGEDDTILNLSDPPYYTACPNPFSREFVAAYATSPDATFHVGAAAGRLLMLQGEFTLAHLTRRLVVAWGERSTLERAVQRIVRSMIQWGVLRDTATRGMYEKAAVHRKVSPAVSKVLIEALLLDAEETSIPFAQLVGHPALFPFDIDLSAGQVRDAPHFTVHRQGLDSDVVEVGAK